MNYRLAGFKQEMDKIALAPLLGALAGGAALGAGAYHAYQGHKQRQAKKKALEVQQARTNRLGQLAPRLDPRLL